MEATWSDWAAENLERGCDKDELVSIMVDKGFSSDDAQALLAETSVATTHAGPQAEPSGPDNGLFLPTALTLCDTDVELYGVDGLLNDAECAHLVALIRQHLRASTTTEEGVSEFRTSRTCELGALNDPLVAEIDRRLCAYLGIDPALGEPLEGQWYDVGQEFKAHTDYFDPGSPGYAEHVGQRGQRSWTVMVYLNTTRKGGATRFPHLDLDVSPQAGSALLWNNRRADGSLNEQTIHHGTPVESGFKAILTKWFRCAEPVVTFSKETNVYLPPLTRSGFVNTRTPKALQQRLLDFYQQGRDATSEESIPEFINSSNGDAPSVLIELSDELRVEVHQELQPILEAWIGDYLEATWVYGIREYRRGSTLKCHRDRHETHVASAILNIDQEVSQDWPLQIEDHHYRRHEVILAPGDMVLYEGARLLHGRETPLDGERFANVFVHFRLAGNKVGKV